MPLSLTEAAQERQDRLFDEEIDGRLQVLLANYQSVTANPRSMGYLRFLLKYYAKKTHPWHSCVADNTKRLGPEKVKALCGVLKDVIRQTTYWRGGVGHSKVPDAGAPGVAIGEADAPAANPPWHGGHGLSEPRCFFDELNAEFGPIDHVAEVHKVIALLTELGESCDPYRVLLGLDEPPKMAAAV